MKYITQNKGDQEYLEQFVTRTLPQQLKDNIESLQLDNGKIVVTVNPSILDDSVKENRVTITLPKGDKHSELRFRKDDGKIICTYTYKHPFYKDLVVIVFPFSMDPIGCFRFI